MTKLTPKDYYRKDLYKLYRFLTPRYARILRVIEEKLNAKGKYDYLIVDNLVGDLKDVQSFFTKVRALTNYKGRVIVTYYNHLWEPILKLATFLGFREVKHEHNWLDSNDISNILELVEFEVITRQKRLLLPIYIPFISQLTNRWLASLPILNTFCLTTWIIARLKPKRHHDYTVSIVVPARNEQENIPKIPKRIPNFGKWQEIIFVEGHSKDKTWEAIKKETVKRYEKGLKISAYKQSGKGKADAVRLGFKKAKGDILMILDADLTVNPLDLKKFYEALATGTGEFINGSRLVYPMEKQAMRTLNKLGNKIFSYLFTWILGQRFKDTLCGTKALFRKDYEWIAKNRKFFGNIDPFGDFDLIFGAVKKNLKVVEIPVRYRERKYGSTNITRFKHGLQLLFMTWVAFRKFKAW